MNPVFLVFLNQTVSSDSDRSDVSAGKLSGESPSTNSLQFSSRGSVMWQCEHVTTSLHIITGCSVHGISLKLQGQNVFYNWTTNSQCCLFDSNLKRFYVVFLTDKNKHQNIINIHKYNTHIFILNWIQHETLNLLQSQIELLHSEIGFSSSFCYSPCFPNMLHVSNVSFSYI